MVIFLLAACQPTAQESSVPAESLTPTGASILAVESFLGDIAQNVAGSRLKVESLMPLGLDPHAFELSPQDLIKVVDSPVIILNGAGLEEALEEAILNAGGEHLLIEASAGLSSRPLGADAGHLHEESDPHFWLDPLNVVKYVENIRDGLSAYDPEGQEQYQANAAAYIEELKQLHQWIEQQVAQIAPERRKLVTNHESFGYFADRYGFMMIGAIIPSVSSGASPSAQQIAGLVEQIRQAGAPAIFLETGANSQLAEQIASETGVQVVTGLYSHSLTEPAGPAPTYIEMMKYNTRLIVSALK